MNKNLLIGLVVGVVVLVGGYFLMNGSTSDDAMMEETAMEEAAEVNIGDDVMMEEETTEKDDAMMESKAVVEVDLTGDNFAFSQEEITVNEGDTVRITLMAKDMPHDWVVDELDARTEIAKPGETVTVEFVADTAGEYEYYCSVGSHRANGMVGTLIVE